MDRRVALEGALNIRDIGGYRTVSGATVRRRSLLRGDNTDALTPSDQKKLHDYGLTSVIDLRDHHETRRWPSVFNDSDVHYTNEALNVSELFEEHTPHGNRLVSWNILLLERRLPAIGTVLRGVGDSLKSGCTLVHCASGKDRTGLIIGLVMLALGVSASTIAADYAQSAQFLAPRIRKWREEARQRGDDPHAFDAEMGSDPEVMLETLAFVETSFGSIEDLLVEAGLPIAWKSELKAHLLE